MSWRTLIWGQVPISLMTAISSFLSVRHSEGASKGIQAGDLENILRSSKPRLVNTCGRLVFQIERFSVIPTSLTR
jgi:hypothetical protein